MTPRHLAAKIAAMNAQQKTVALAVAVSGVTAVVCALLLRFVLSEPEWMSSGDGYTIFNTRTGEVIYTRSGRSVTEVQAERKRESAERERKSQESQQRWERQRIADQRNRSAAVQRNSELFHKLKKFADAHPEVEGRYPTEWEMFTKPFRTNKHLSRFDQERLLDFLGRAIKTEPYKSDRSFHEAIEDLKKWDFAHTLRY